MSDFCISIIGSLIGTVIGGIITILVSRWYYKKSTNDLAKIGKKLYYNTRQVLLGLKYAGLIDVEIEPDEDHTDQFRVVVGIPGPKLS